MTLKCTYCKKPSKLVKSEEVYGQGHNYGWMYFCRPCDAYVGCHKGTTDPMGTLADKPTREARKLAHQHFDPLWRNGVPRNKHAWKRREMYTHLSVFMGIKREDAHIGLFTEADCLKVIDFVLFFRNKHTK